MKRTRILMLALGLALFAGAAFAEPADAQCYDCQWGYLTDEDGNRCFNCTIGQAGFGVRECSTPECMDCDVGDDPEICLIFGMLDGRAAPTGQFELPRSGTPVELLTLNAPDGATGPVAPVRRTSEIRRSCDGSILEIWYTPAEVSAIRSETAQLRL